MIRRLLWPDHAAWAGGTSAYVGVGAQGPVRQSGILDRKDHGHPRGRWGKGPPLCRSGRASYQSRTV